MWSALLGFAAPWAGDVLGIVKSVVNGRQERLMMKLQNEADAKAEARRSEREFDIAELRASISSQASARKQQASWGVQLLNAVSSASVMAGPIVPGSTAAW